MEHFISIIYSESVDERSLAECLASSNNVLSENEIEFETGSVGGYKTIRMPLPEAVKNVDETAEALAMRLFEFGLKNFEIELTEATLRRGSRGPEVQALQQQLGIAADGIYGPNTEAAVRAFQQRAGIQVDGIAGGQTQSALAAGGSPRNAGAPRASTAPFTPGSGSTTQAPPQPQSAAPQTSPRPQARPEQPAGGLDDTAARAEISRQRADQIAAAQRRRNPDATDPRGPDQRNVPAPQTARGRGDGSAEVARRRDDREADQLAQDTLAALDANPAPQGELSATDQAQIGTPSSRLDRQGETPSGPVGQAMDQRGAAAAGTPPPDPDANDPRLGNTDSGARGNPNLPEPEVMTTPPTMSAPADDNAPGIGAQSIPVTGNRPDDPAISRQTPAAPQFGGGERDVNVDTSAPSQVAPGVDTQVAQGVAGTFYQAMKGGTGIGTNKGQIRSQLRQLEDADTFRAAAEAYQQENGRDLFADFYDEMSDRHIDQYVRPELDRLGIEMPPRSQYESVAPRPKGAFMFRERNEWIANYGKTHNTNGTPKQRYLSESIQELEETYDDDDAFFETYGILGYVEEDGVFEAEYQGRKVKLNKPMAGDVKKFKVYVKNKKGNVVKVNFGQKGVKIKKDNPKRRRSFRARHNCENPGPKWKARYWSCKKW